VNGKGSLFASIGAGVTGTRNMTQLRMESWLSKRNRSVDLMKPIVLQTGGKNIFNMHGRSGHERRDGAASSLMQLERDGNNST
jgi:hypothetical protein